MGLAVNMHQLFSFTNNFIYFLLQDIKTKLTKYIIICHCSGFPYSSKSHKTRMDCLFI